MTTIPQALQGAGRVALSALEDSCLSLADLISPPAGTDASWGKETDIASRFNKGFVISRHRKLSRKSSFQSLVLCAPTGSGKTTAFLIKQLLELKHATIVVTDPNKDIFNSVSGYRSQNSIIKCLNLSNADESIGFNFLHGIRSPNDIRVHKIADMLVKATLDKGGNTDQFWSLSVKSLLSILIRLTLHQPEAQRHMASVLYALSTFSSSPEKVDLLVVRTGDKKLIEQYKSMVSTPQKTLQNIVASARACLQPFESEAVERVTSCHTLDFNELRRRPHILFLHHSPSEGKMLSSLIGLFFELLYMHLLDKQVAKDDLDLFIILEETASTYIPILSQALSLTRKTRTANFLCIQSESQLKSLYRDEAVNIMENCQTKIFLPGISAMDTLRQIETLSGKAQVKDATTGHYKTAPLISANAIRTLGKNRTLILSGRNPLILPGSPKFLSK